MRKTRQWKRRRPSNRDASCSAEQPPIRASETARSDAHPAEHWEIWASREQVVVPQHELTHTRALPLPFTIDGRIMGRAFSSAQYAGHGQSKVVYRLTQNLVLKLRKEKDPEPNVFQALQAIGVYPKVHASSLCRLVQSARDCDQTWHAWVVEYAEPLDQILIAKRASSKMCIHGAVHAMVMAYSGGHVLSDSALLNFGLAHDNVVIIDAGSRTMSSEMSKGEFNRKVMRRFWSKAETVVHPTELQRHKKQWASAGEDMSTALQTYQTTWKCQLFPVLNSLQVPDSTMTLPNSTSSTCPHVASVLDSLDVEILEWLTRTYLWGDVARYGRSSDGYTRHQSDRVWTAAQKLEQVISETHARRVAYCDNPAEEILEENKLKDILDSWKDEYEQWMRPETLEKTWSMNWTQWHVFLRTALRSHIFQFVGSYEIVIFFIVAPFNNDNLSIFRHVATRTTSKKDILQRCKDYVRSPLSHKHLFE